VVHTAVLIHLQVPFSGLISNPKAKLTLNIQPGCPLFANI